MAMPKLSPRFLVIAAAAVSLTLLSPTLLWYGLSVARIQPRWWFEVIAWLLMACTYLLFIPAEWFGPRVGLKRLVNREWSFIPLYVAVFSGVAGVVAGAALLHVLGVGGCPTLPMISVAIVLYHFVVRHLFTEQKGTPHLGQRGDPAGQRRERVLGQIGDLALVGLLYWVYVLTSHPIWWYGAVILTVGYMLGVWIHAWLDPEAHAGTSYLAVLACLVITVAAVIRFGFFPEISRLDVLYGNAFLAALVGLSGIFIQARTAAAIAAGGGLALGTSYGLLLSGATIPTSFHGMLLNSSASSGAVNDYSLFLIVACCGMNVFLANLKSVYKTFRRDPTEPRL